MNSEVNVELNGIVTEAGSSASEGGEMGAPVRGFAVIRTVRFYDGGPERVPALEDVRVNIDGVPEAENMNPGDIVHVKGTLAGNSVKRGFICSACGEEAVIPGIETYVVPESISVTGHGPDGGDEVDVRMLREALGGLFEHSNEVTVTNVVQARAPMFDDRRRTCAYRVDAHTEDGDIPVYVRSFGDTAVSDNEHMRDRFDENGNGTGAVLTITGALRCKPGHTKRLRCRKCGEVNESVDSIGTVEIVPSSVEYAD